jgi:hypothetical protein
LRLVEKKPKNRTTWYRLPEKKKSDPRVKRRRLSSSGPEVLYLNKGAYEGDKPASSEKNSVSVDQLNEEFGLKLADDVDALVSEVFKRGWKVSAIELNHGKQYIIRFLRDVGGNKSRTFIEKSDSLKKLMLKAMKVILTHEASRHKDRLRKSRRRVDSGKSSDNVQ